MLQRNLDLRGGRRLGPAEQLESVRAAALDRDAVVGQDLAGEVDMLLGHHVLQRLGQLIGGHVRVHALVLAGDHDVDAVRVVTDVLVDPVQLDLELVGREADGTEDAEAACLAHGDHDVTAMGEGEDRELDSQLIAEGGVHVAPWREEKDRKTGTCSSLVRRPPGL